VQVNRNPEPLGSGLGTDAYMPGVAVDNSTGEVGVCWYDRRNDPLNFRVDRFCGHTTDAGATFTNKRATFENFPPIHGTDDLVNPSYFGDYDTVASDALQTTRGFTGAFQVAKGEGRHTLVPNPEVKANNFNCDPSRLPNSFAECRVPIRDGVCEGYGKRRKRTR
jgi:hypothetical protein